MTTQQAHSRFIRKPLARAIQYSLLASCLLALPPTALAQQAEGQSAATQQRYSIEAGRLDTALNRFAVSAGIEIAFDATLTAGKQTAGLQGNYGVDEGLERLLAGTGLAAVRSAEGSYRLEERHADVELSTMRVEADWVQETASGPVDGYLATRSATATKTDTPILETPRNISVVTTEQIDDRKAISVEEAVAYSSGVSTGSSGLDPRFDQIRIRGYSATSNADYLDGLRQPNTGWLSYFASDPFALERIEILKGPSSVLYGQISPGGMVNRVSKRPSEQAVEQVELQYGSHDHVQGQFDVGGALNKNGSVLYRLVGVARSADTDIEQVPNDVALLAPSLNWKLDENTELTILAQYQDRETAGSPRPYQAGDDLTEFWAGDEDFDRLSQHQALFGYEFEHRFTDDISFHNTLRYGTTKTTNQYTSSTSTGNQYVLDRTAWGVYENMDAVTTDTRLVSEFATGALEHTLLTGIDYAYLDFDVEYAMGSAPSIDRRTPDYRQNIVRPDTVLTDQNGTSHRTGIYLNDQVSVGQWRLSAGLRQDRVESDTTNNLTQEKSESRDHQSTAQLGALYLFDSGLAPYISYAQSFLPQSGTDADGNDFKPTEGEQVEVGIKYQPPGSRTMLTASAYNLVQDNTLTSLPGTAFSIQKGEETSKGIEIELTSELIDGLEATASYSFNDAEVTKSNDGDEGNTPTLIPRHLASIWLDYTIPDGPLSGLGISGGARYVGSSYANSANTQKNEAHTKIDVGASYQFSGSQEGMELGLNVKNVTDEQDIVCDAGYCYRGAGRAVIGSVVYRW